MVLTFTHFELEHSFLKYLIDKQIQLRFNS